MSATMEFSTHYAEALRDDTHLFEGGEFDQHDVMAGQSPSAVIAADTRRLWRDYLAQFDVTSAILTVSLPGAGLQRHAFLIGFDQVRGDATATRRLMAMMDDVWARIGDQPVHHFQFSGALFGVAEVSNDAVDLDGDVPLHSGIAVQMKREGRAIRALFFRPNGTAQFSDRDAASLQLIAPLLAESATGVAQLARQSQRSAMLEGMFDRVSMAMALLSADGQPLFLNSAATGLVERRKWLLRAADGTIVAANPGQAKQLRESIRRAATAAPDAPVEDVFRLDCRDGEWRLAYVMSAKSRTGDSMTRCAMVIIMAPGKVDAPTSLLEALGLLPSEQRFLGHFLKSSSLCNAAEGCGLSEETARTYLKRVRAKLGVHRQMELAGLISGLVLPLHAADSPAVWER
ncbi:MAG: sigma-70 region 4 domain-containing protein [Alphaproteobacteria bacterium]|nr:sigma-70 region 4 domain-containing protein [Alphaproteobacteria bacterium]MBU0863136.1 sigma-70 region 4 domain-containing protein [Alphaproteobacteria bacterium]MBU1825201.1 sigma-70 region 4 domain-containing protein [Alphaproteobacteria bacterium]